LDPLLDVFLNFGPDVLCFLSNQTLGEFWFAARVLSAFGSLDYRVFSLDKFDLPVARNFHERSRFVVDIRVVPKQAPQQRGPVIVPLRPVQRKHTGNRAKDVAEHVGGVEGQHEDDEQEAPKLGEPGVPMEDKALDQVVQSAQLREQNEHAIHKHGDIRKVHFRLLLSVFADLVRVRLEQMHSRCEVLNDE
jgi:hypothetical protein